MMYEIGFLLFVLGGVLIPITLSGIFIAVISDFKGPDIYQKIVVYCGAIGLLSFMWGGIIIFLSEVVLK